MKPVLLRVEQDGTAIDEVRRMLRRLPDNRIGAEYMGLVYPLASTDSISLDAQWFYPSDAPICLDPPQLPNAESHTWHLERVSSRSYLFLRGSGEYLERAVSALEAANIPVEHWGPSFRDDAEGQLYDWFIRISVDAADMLDTWEVEQILAPIPVDLTPDTLSISPEEQVARSRRLVDALLRRQAEAERQLAVALAEAEAQSALHTETSKRASERQRRLETEIAFLKAGFAAARAAGEPASPEDQPLKVIIDELRAERDEALERWADAEDAKANVESELRTRKARLEELSAGLPIAPPPGRGRQRALEELETTLRTLIPNVQLVRGSLEFIGTEIEDKRDLYSKLRLLSDSPESIRGKRVHTADGWLEVHFSTGRGRDGRLYYKRDNFRGAPGWRVLVSDKAAQPNDISWLGGQ